MEYGAIIVGVNGPGLCVFVLKAIVQAISIGVGGIGIGAELQFLGVVHIIEVGVVVYGLAAIDGLLVEGHLVIVGWYERARVRGIVGLDLLARETGTILLEV